MINGNRHIVILTLVILSGLLMNLAGQSPAQLTLIFAGDIMGHDTQIESAKMSGNGEYDYTENFRHVEPYISAADIAIGNLEVTLAGPPYKGYPEFSSPDALAVALKNAGFDILVNANNHALDRKRSGLERTIKVLDSLGIIQTGVFADERSREERYPLIVEKNSIRLALLNYTYGTNGIRVTPPNIVNFIDTIQIKEDLRKASTADPDFTIVLMHWGAEYQLTENREQQNMAAFLFRNGVDAIIGSHPHVVQPIREYEGGKVVVYSLGNMISNQRKRYTDGGILFDMTLEKGESTRIIDYSYLPVWVYKAETEKGNQFTLVPANADSMLLQKLNMPPADAESMQLFLKDTRENLKGTGELKHSLEELQ
jgi:poly-gamma-glutamate synthesis protein (capsule biosynthesis protein)